MHTVIITDGQTTRKFTEYRHLFVPFLDERGGSVCVCRWDETGRTIEEAVPELYKSIKGHPEWRAIILVHPLQKKNEPDDELTCDPRNPFDFKCNHGKWLPIKENPAPLVRLTHMLAGFPSLGVKEYQIGYALDKREAALFKSVRKYRIFHTSDKKEAVEIQEDFIIATDTINDKDVLLQRKIEEIRKNYEETKRRSHNEFEKFKAMLNNKDNVHSQIEELKNKLLAIRKIITNITAIEKKIVTIEKNTKPLLYEILYEPKEKEKHQELTEQYALKENHPVEVVILSTREIYTADDRETTREEVRRAWQSFDEEESSDFWTVYPNKCRFICYDLINQEHTLYSRDLWCFYLLALTLAINKVSGQALQAYRLYKGSLDISPGELKYVLEGHIKKLMSIQAVIGERMARVPELTQEKQNELVPNRDIAVRFEQVDESKVKIDGGKLGLSADCPISETQFWYDHIQGTKQTVDNILSAPQEIVVGKALETRLAADSYMGIEQVLDRFQLDRVRKRRDELEPRVINSSVYGLLDADSYKAEVAEAGDAVRKSIGLRLTKRNILLISICSLLVYLCGYIPYFINSAKISWPVFGAAFGLAAIALVFLVAGGLLTLWFLRRKLVQKLKTYNKTVKDIFSRLSKGAGVFSEYFSGVCTYMYAHSLLSGVILKKDNDYTAAKILKAHCAFLKNVIKTNRELCSLYDVTVDDSLISDSFMDIKEEDLLQWPSKSWFYELAHNREKGTLKLANTGETLDAPYSFITSISLVREEIYDKKERA